jgi:hypothetical protein
MTIAFGVLAVLSIAVSRVAPIGSLYEYLFSLLGIALIIFALISLFFFFTLQWRWTHGQPQPRSMG